jgi:D-3-phosphoglycerate dehydrogenase
VVTTAVNAPALAPEDLEALGPFVPLCQHLGKIGVALAAGSSVDRVEVELLGRIAERDTRLLVTSVLLGILAGHTEEEVNAVNAPSIAEERGIEVHTRADQHARDYTDLVRVTVTSGDESTRVVGTNLGRQHRPHLLEAWGHRFNLQLEENLSVFRYSDVPGMIGIVGVRFGDAGINISAAAVGHRPDGEAEGQAVMAVTTEVPVPDEVMRSVLAAEGFETGRTVSLV